MCLRGLRVWRREVRVCEPELSVLGREDLPVQEQDGGSQGDGPQADQLPGGLLLSAVLQVTPQTLYDKTLLLYITSYTARQNFIQRYVHTIPSV